MPATNGEGNVDNGADNGPVEPNEPQIFIVPGLTPPIVLPSGNVIVSLEALIATPSI
jgi:hypothetical protein